MNPSKPKFEIIDIDNVGLTVDVSGLSRSNEIFFNATEMASQFGKRPGDFLRLESTDEYIKEVLAESQNGINHFENLVRTVQGGKYRGTWLHSELAFEFAGWCSAIFRRKLHKWVDERIRLEQQQHGNRLELKTGYLPMTRAIQEAHSDLKPYHFSNECDLINRLVTGMTAKQFKSAKNVTSVREALTLDELQFMNKLQRHNTALIELGFSYTDRKSLLQSRINQSTKVMPDLSEANDVLALCA